MNVASSTVNVLSLCSGYGGLDLGVDLATGGSTRTICYVEREAFAAAILACRMAEEAMDEAPVWSDLRTFDGRPWRGLVDCITGGYPCQPFSQAGKRLGEQDERHLWPDIARIIGEVEPGVVFFENVSGHLSLGFDAVRTDLERLGYRVAAGLFSAAEVGASHRRERLFILGVADSRGERPQGFCQGGAEAWSARRGGGTDLADTMHGDEWRRGSECNVDAGQQAGSGGRCCASDSPDDLLADLGPFPPGPTDTIAWRRILADRPDLAPATQSGVCGVADGGAARMDRLRILGNGVVPLVAAYAFTSLWACLEQE